MSVSFPRMYIYSYCLVKQLQDVHERQKQEIKDERRIAEFVKRIEISKAMFRRNHQ